MQYAFPSWELCEACHRRRDSSPVGSTVQSELAQVSQQMWVDDIVADAIIADDGAQVDGKRTDAGVGEHGHLTADDGIANMG